jgi:hypothetical protein
MSPTMNVDEETKAELDELQSAIERETDQTVPSGDIVSRVVEDASEARSDVVAAFDGSTVPLSEEKRERMNQGTFSSRVEADEEDIDEILYGSEHNP